MIDEIKSNKNFALVIVIKEQFILYYVVFRWRRFQFLWNESSSKNKEVLITNTSIENYENIFKDLKCLMLYFSSMPLYKKIHCAKYVLL